MALKMINDDWIGISSYKVPIRDKSFAEDPNVVKVVTDKSGKALYFSRSLIPYNLGQEGTISWFRHMGIYGFRNKVLQTISALPQTNLEKAESLEQLRWMENGYQIQMLTTEHESLGIDSPEDIELARKMINVEKR